MARSGVENIVRMVLAGAGGDYQVTSVYSLFDNANDALKNQAASRRLLGNLRALYSELCLTVHSAHEDHLALRIPFEKAFSYDEKQFALTIAFLSRASSNINQLLFSYFSDKLHNLEHKNRDFILDSLPKSLKRTIQD
jgi:hypothetical protein